MMLHELGIKASYAVDSETHKINYPCLIYCEASAKRVFAVLKRFCKDPSGIWASVKRALAVHKRGCKCIKRVWATVNVFGLFLIVLTTITNVYGLA